MRIRVIVADGTELLIPAGMLEIKDDLHGFVVRELIIEPVRYQTVINLHRRVKIKLEQLSKI